MGALFTIARVCGRGRFDFLKHALNHELFGSFRSLYLHSASRPSERGRRRTDESGKRLHDFIELVVFSRALKRR